jgi:hypothetical protein
MGIRTGSGAGDSRGQEDPEEESGQEFCEQKHRDRIVPIFYINVM